MPNHPAISERIALITGAAQRLGAEIARCLHADGMQLALHYRQSAGAAEHLCRELEAIRPDSVLLLRADLCDTAAFPGLIEQVQRRFGGLDVLVNNASAFYPTPFEQATPEDWEYLMATNVRAPFFLAQAAAPLLRQRQGCIVNLVDIHAERPLQGHPIYSIAKAANAMLVKSLARELAPEIRVNGVAPGAILWPEQGMAPNAQAEILARTALGRLGTPGDIARSVRFLIRDADYITGQIISVDGGRSLQQ